MEARKLRLIQLSLALGWCFVATPAPADTWVLLVPGQRYEISLRSRPGAHRLIFSTKVDRAGLSSLDRWFQVSPDGRSVAIGTASSGFVVYAGNGEELLRRASGVTAFRFSPAGDRIAFASTEGVEVAALDRRQPRVLASLPGTDSLHWTDRGLVARVGSKLYLVNEDGTKRILAQGATGLPFAAAQSKLVYFAGRSMFTLDLTRLGVPPAATHLEDRDPVINVEISPDGRQVLFATAKRVYLREDDGPVKFAAECTGVRSLFFSPDGESYFWSGGGPSDAVVRQGQKHKLPAGTRSACFAKNGGRTLVLTTMDAIIRWDPETGEKTTIGGISAYDGINVAGDVLGDAGVVALYYRKSLKQKEQETPSGFGRP